MPVLFLTLILQSFLPIFDAPDNEYIGLSLVNTAAEAAVVTVTVTANDGSGAQSGAVILSAGSQRALLIQEILGTEAAPSSGWIRVDSTQSGTEIFAASGNGGFLGSAPPATSLSTSLILPNIQVDTGFKELGATDTLVAIVFPGSFFPATVTVELVGLDALVAGSVTITMVARSSQVFGVSDVFRDFMPDNGVGGRSFQGYLRLRSTLGIAAWGRVETPLFRTTQMARSVTEVETSTTVLAPYFVFGGGYRAVLNVVNPTDQAVSLELVAEDGRGGTIGETANVTLAPGQGLRSGVQELFGVVTVQTFPGPMFSGYIRIKEPDNNPVRLVGNVDIYSIGQGTFFASAMSYPLRAAALNWMVPFALGGSDYYSGYAIANLNELLAVQTDVTIEVFASDGALIETTQVSMSPRRQHAAVVPEGLTSGYLRITSNIPVALVAALGTRDRRLLEQVPVTTVIN